MADETAEPRGRSQGSVHRKFGVVCPHRTAATETSWSITLKPLAALAASCSTSLKRPHANAVFVSRSAGRITLNQSLERQSGYRLGDGAFVGGYGSCAARREMRG